MACECVHEQITEGVDTPPAAQVTEVQTGRCMNEPGTYRCKTMCPHGIAPINHLQCQSMIQCLFTFRRQRAHSGHTLTGTQSRRRGLILRLPRLPRPEGWTWFSSRYCSGLSSTSSTSSSSFFLAAAALAFLLFLRAAGGSSASSSLLEVGGSRGACRVKEAKGESRSGC